MLYMSRKVSHTECFFVHTADLFQFAYRLTHSGSQFLSSKLFFCSWSLPHPRVCCVCQKLAPASMTWLKALAFNVSSQRVALPVRAARMWRSSCSAQAKSTTSWSRSAKRSTGSMMLPSPELNRWEWVIVERVVLDWKGGGGGLGKPSQVKLPQ